MIINGNSLLEAAPIKNMLTEKRREHGVSHGLAEAGYDIRIKQDIWFSGSESLTTDEDGYLCVPWGSCDKQDFQGTFTLASAIEEFQMPDNLVGFVKDKSTWARQGLSVFNTVIEPGWNGFLTLELVYHGQGELHIPAGAGIAQVVFNKIAEPNAYEGKYQGQADRPVESRFVNE